MPSMTHEELLASLKNRFDYLSYFDYLGKEIKPVAEMMVGHKLELKALRAVVELHKPEHSIRGYRCTFDDEEFPCTHQRAIEKALS